MRKENRVRSSKQAYKICPICGTPAPISAVSCGNCGTSLTSVASVDDTQPIRTQRGDYDRRYGEADLAESELRHPGRGYLLTAALAVILVACLLGAIVGGAFVADRLGTFGGELPLSPAPQALSGDQPLTTNTPRPTLQIETVTPAPPSATATFTPGPCQREVQPGSDLTSLAMSCGHRSMDVMPLILEMNNLASANQIQAGQTILIPLPTPTIDPNASASVSSVPTANAVPVIVGTPNVIEAIFDLADISPTPYTPSPTATETLLPGVMMHVVQPNESLIDIVFRYQTEAEVLDQLNPEISFSQCDYSSATGGPECTVLLQIGQQVRVPAPTPTATLSPTLTGSETATPTATATFNAPSPLSPADRVLFFADDLITLRWIATGTLSANEVYRITLHNRTAGASYTGDTTELSFIIPDDWRPAAGENHEYQWFVSVIQLDRPDMPLFTTPPRSFTWQGYIP